MAWDVVAAEWSLVCRAAGARLDLSLMLPAPGNSRALKRHWSQLEARPVPVCPYALYMHACLLRRTSD